MPSEIVRTLHHTWQVLTALQMPAAIMGGMAVSIWKHIRSTRDVDLLISLGSTEPMDLLKRLQEHGFRPKRFPPITDFDDGRVLQLMYDLPGAYLEIQVDLLFAESEYEREAFSRRIPFRCDDPPFDAFILSCEDMILHKLMADRVIDRMDAVGLLKANQDQLDLNYLRKWVDPTKTREEWRYCWANAFPGAPSPI